MATIKISRNIDMGQQEAVAYFRQHADHVSSEYDLDWQWQDNQATVTGRGLKGNFTIAERHVDIEVRLGLLLSAFSSKIERELNSFIDKLA